MWITRQEYRLLIDGKARAETTVQLLTMQLNTANHDLAQYRAAQTGHTQLVPRMESVHTVKPSDDQFDGFEDVGDEDARRLGIATDETGRLALTTR